MPLSHISFWKYLGAVFSNHLAPAAAVDAATAALGFLFLFPFLVELALLLGGGVLVLLVLGHQVVHVRLGLGELHLVHAFSGVPMQESLSPEHGGELFRDSLEELLNGGGVADECGGHLQTARRNVANRSLDVVG